MPLNMRVLGRPIGPFKRDYTWKDAILYALGVGAGFSELDYCYEKNLKIIPSFAMAMIFDFLSQATISAGVDLAGVLHGEQELIFHNPMPTEGTLITTGKVVDYYDKGKAKGALIVIESETRHGNGQKLFTSIATVFSRLDGGFGGKDRQSVPVEFPSRAPDYVVDATPSPDQPLIYRLSGDVFHLHVDPQFAAMAGFERPIMHGLCTHGFACRALIAALTPGHPGKVRRLACRFSKALYPGTPIRTQIWNNGDGKALWRMVATDTDQVIIDNGEFEYGDIPRDEIRFDDRVAIVTGAGAGLGRIYALELARRGARVVVNDLGGARDGAGKGSASPADAVVAEIRANGGQAVASYASVATAEGGESIIKTALDAFGTVDILINNAGILRDKSFPKLDPQDWQAVVDVHLNGAYNVTRPAFAVMKAKRYGRIIMTTSAAGLYGNFGQTHYAAAKMGLVGLMNTLKLEGERYDIKVNAVAPVAASRFTADVMPPEILERSRPEFVAPLVLYLCSDRCAANGDIFNAAMGYYSRVAVVTAPARMLARPGEVPTPEAIMANITAISDLAHGKTYPGADAFIGDLLTLPPAPDQPARPAGSKIQASVEAVFHAMPGTFVAEAAAGVDVVFQYRIDGAGEWFCTIKDATCIVSAGQHPQPTCTFNIAAGDFLKLVSGELPAMQAFSFGKLKIEGDLMKSQLVEQLFRRA